jgi:hypothetical protein
MLARSIEIRYEKFNLKMADFDISSRLSESYPFYRLGEGNFFRQIVTHVKYGLVYKF